MAWTNAFEIGDCTLTVHKDGSAAAMTPEEMTSDGVSLSADVAGLITLTAPEIVGTGSYEVRVTPDFDTASSPVRVTEVADTIATAGDAFPKYYPSWSPDPTPNGEQEDMGDAFDFFDLFGEAAWTWAGVMVEKELA